MGRTRVHGHDANDNMKIHSVSVDSKVMKTYKNKTLGRAPDPRANGAWLSKLTE